MTVEGQEKPEITFVCEDRNLLRLARRAPFTSAPRNQWNTN